MFNLPQVLKNLPEEDKKRIGDTDKEFLLLAVNDNGYVLTVKLTNSSFHTTCLLPINRVRAILNDEEVTKWK